MSETSVGVVAPCFHNEAFEKMKPEKAKRQEGADSYLYAPLVPTHKGDILTPLKLIGICG